MNRNRYANQSDCNKIRDEKYLFEQSTIDPITLKVISKPVLDHDHSNGRIRAVLDDQTNKWEGFTQKAFIKHMGGRAALHEYTGCLRRLADYLDDYWPELPIHHTHRKVETREFKKLNAEQQKEALVKLNAETPIPTNEKGRVVLFKQLMGH